MQISFIGTNVMTKYGGNLSKVQNLVQASLKKLNISASEFTNLLLNTT